MKDCTVGDNVAVPIPSVDRGRGDSRNILGVILAVVNGQYTIGCFSGILKGKYSRHQFDLCPTDGMGTATLSPTVQSFIITRLRLTIRSACFCCAAIASFLSLSTLLVG
jgi:hypothetical protein